MTREMVNDGPEVAEACDFCTHPWTEHHVEAGCIHGWLNKGTRKYLVGGERCYCRLAHTGVVSV